MSIIVRNMDMPERCGRCHFVRWSNLHQTAWCTLAQEACFEDFSKDYKNRRADFCPLVEIPTPHGRLIDIKSVEYGKFTTVGNEYQRWWNGALESVIDNAPTVIEAEGETGA